MERIYVILIKKHLKTFEQVPDWFKNEVYAELERQGLLRYAIVNGKPYTIEQPEEPVEEPVEEPIEEPIEEPKQTEEPIENGGEEPIGSAEEE